jgi:hypothetical protein
MDASRILEEGAAKTGWNEYAMLYLACEYIDQQHDNAAFKDFVAQHVADETTETQE